MFQCVWTTLGENQMVFVLCGRRYEQNISFLRFNDVS